MPEEFEFIQLNNGGGGAGGGGGGGVRRNNNIVPPPPPPPPPPRAPGQAANLRPPVQQRPPANVVNAVHPQQAQQQALRQQQQQQQAMQQQQMLMQQGLLPPPANMVPARLQQRPLVEFSDITRERLSDAEVREELSDYVIVRFEKAGGENDDGYDSDGEKTNSPWARCRLTQVRDLDKKHAQRQIRFLDKTTKPVEEKKRAFNPTQQRQIERVLEDLRAGERDPHYHYVLAQVDHITKHVPDQRRRKRSTMTLTREKTWRTDQGRRKSKDRGKSKERSRDRHKDRKQKRIRVAITAYYKRCPRPEENARFLLQHRELQAQRNLLPPTTGVNLPGTMPAQAHAQQGQGYAARRPGPGGAIPPTLPNAVQVLPQQHEQKKDKKKEKKDHNQRSPRSSRSSYSSYSDSDGSGSENGTALTSPSEPSSSGRRSGNRGRRRSSRYLESPGAYGVEAGVTRHRPTRYNQHRLSDEMLPPRVPAAPRLITAAIDLEQEKANAYAAGRADEADIRNRAADEALVLAARSAYTPRTAPRPRVIQRRSSIRHIHPGDLSLSLEDEEDLEYQFRRIRLDDEFSLEDRAFEEEIRQDERRRIADWEERMRQEDARREEEEYFRREDERNRPPREYMRRRASSPITISFENPFTPRERRGSFRRVSASSPHPNYPDAPRQRV